jgi:hypothetical protein
LHGFDKARVRDAKLAGATNVGFQVRTLELWNRLELAFTILRRLGKQPAIEIFSHHDDLGSTG